MPLVVMIDCWNWVKDLCRVFRVFGIRRCSEKLEFSQIFMHRLATLTSLPSASVVDSSLHGCEGRYWVWVLLQSKMKLAGCI